MVLVVILVMETALCVQAFVEMAANKMEQLVDVLTNGVRMNHGMIHCHLLREDALRSPVCARAHTHARTHTHTHTFFFINFTLFRMRTSM